MTVELVRVSAAKSWSALIFIPLSADLSTPTSALATVPHDRDVLVALAPGEALLHPSFAAIVREAAAERPDVEIFYGDEAGPSALFLKPGYNAALLRAQAYTGAHLIVRASALHRLGGLKPEAASASLYDLVLRGDEEGAVIDAIRSVLLAFPGDRPAPTSADRRRALEALAARSEGDLDILAGLTPRSLRVRRRFDPPPMVTLVVPTRRTAPPGGEPYVATLLKSLVKSAWPKDRLSVLIGDDLEPGEELGAITEAPFPVRRVHTPRPPGAAFNYAAKMNWLWRAAETEHLVLMNDDVEVLAPDWLEAMMTFAVEEDVGGVGARLLYPDGSLQHAGMIGGLFGVFAHAWIGQPADGATYDDWAMVQRDWSAVTGAVFATRRSVLEAVNGFDEGFALEYNDVDLCLRLRATGRRIVQAPDAVLLHHEKASRGRTAPEGSQTAAFLRRWQQTIADDPAYHPGLSRDSFVVSPVAEAGAWHFAPTSHAPADAAGAREALKNGRDKPGGAP